MLGYAALRCCDRLAGALYRNIVGRKMLRAFGHHVAMCYMLRVVENGQIFHATFVEVA